MIHILDHKTIKSMNDAEKHRTKNMNIHPRILYKPAGLNLRGVAPSILAANAITIWGATPELINQCRGHRTAMGPTADRRRSNFAVWAPDCGVFQHGPTLNLSNPRSWVTKTRNNTYLKTVKLALTVTTWKYFPVLPGTCLFTTWSHRQPAPMGGDLCMKLYNCFHHPAHSSYLTTHFGPRPCGCTQIWYSIEYAACISQGYIYIYICV